jgi:hypothetical protein
MPAGTTPRRTTRKGPTDLTGRTDEKLKAENQAAIDRAAEQMSMITVAENRSRGDVIDYTDEARPPVAPAPVIEEPKIPKKYKIRLVADIDNMTFGKEIIDPGDFSDPNNPRMPMLGSLKTYDFKEGREYLVDENLYIHLRDLGYVYE